MIFLDTPTMIYILLGLIVVLLVWIVRTEIRLGRLLRGKSGKDLESTIENIYQETKELSKFRDDSIGYFKLIEMRLKRSVRAIETVRFNPFKGNGSGGNQSFSTSFINEEGDGVVITSLYSRDHVSVFSKPIKNFSSDFELSQEEKSVINNSKESLKFNKNNS